MRKLIIVVLISSLLAVSNPSTGFCSPSAESVSARPKKQQPGDSITQTLSTVNVFLYSRLILPENYLIAALQRHGTHAYPHEECPALQWESIKQTVYPRCNSPSLSV